MVAYLQKAFPPSFPETGRPEVFAPPNLCNALLSHPEPPVQTAQCRATPCYEPRLATSRSGKQPLRAGGAAGIASEGWPPARGARMPQRYLQDCAPEGSALKCRLKFLYTRLRYRDRLQWARQWVRARPPATAPTRHAGTEIDVSWRANAGYGAAGHR